MVKSDEVECSEPRKGIKTGLSKHGISGYLLQEEKKRKKNSSSNMWTLTHTRTCTRTRNTAIHARIRGRHIKVSTRPRPPIHRARLPTPTHALCIVGKRGGSAHAGHTPTADVEPGPTSAGRAQQQPTSRRGQSGTGERKRTWNNTTQPPPFACTTDRAILSRT